MEALNLLCFCCLDLDGSGAQKHPPAVALRVPRGPGLETMCLISFHNPRIGLPENLQETPETHSFGEATRNKCIATSNKCHTSSNKKLLETIS